MVWKFSFRSLHIEIQIFKSTSDGEMTKTKVVVEIIHGRPRFRVKYEVTV